MSNITGITTIEISPETDIIIIEVLVEILSFRLIMIKGTPIISPDIKLIIKRVINVIMRKDQKFLADALKNSEELKRILFFLRPEKSPPARKVFRKKPVIIRSINPVEKNETMTFKADPRSVKISVLNPSASFSVIILFPNADFNAPFKGIARIETRMSVRNHVIKIPLQDLTDLLVPLMIELKIFIKFCFIKKIHL